MKKIAFFLLGGFIFLPGCARQNTGQTLTNEATKSPTKTEVVAGPCQKEAVQLEGYGDKGQRLTNCFVEYPGEPTREDKSYYIIEDICGQFTQKFIENLLGRQLTKIEPSALTGLNNCIYHLNDKDNFLLNLEYLSIENQKKGNEAIGRKTETSALIPLENLVVFQDDGAVNVVYLVLDPNKFISIRPINKNVFPGTELINFAAKLGGEIKNYK